MSDALPLSDADNSTRNSRHASTPVMIPIAKPFLNVEEADAAREVVLSGWLSQGAQVSAFEQEFAALTGAEHACAVSNCTTALHLALLAAGVGPGDEVITSSHSFIATANSIRYCGATPIFVDIEAATYNLDPDYVANAITERTRAILAVHQVGMPCDLKRLIAVANNYGIPVIEDAACAIGSQINVDGIWEHVGKPRGMAACFSFHPRKVVTTGEGGMLTTSDPEIDRKLRLWRQHGMNVPDTVRHSSTQIIFESYDCVGFNYRMTDIQAAVGRKQLERLSEIVARRRMIASRYGEMLGDIEGLTLPFEPEWARSNWQSYCIRLPDRVDQKAVMQSLLDQGIATRRGIMCSHREAPYINVERRYSLLQSELAQDHTILLPLFAQLNEDQQTFIAGALRKELQVSTKSKPAG